MYASFAVQTLVDAWTKLYHALQAARANALAEQQGLADRVTFQVADALQQPFADSSFDLIWSLESGEHMPNKERFVGELARVCAPGGRIIIVTWCHRLGASNKSCFHDKGVLRIADILHGIFYTCAAMP